MAEEPAQAAGAQQPRRTRRRKVIGDRRGSSAVRDVIIAAAIREFAAHGIAGARVDRIAAAAGVNKRLLYHYVGNKEALYLAALERVYRAIRAEELAVDLSGLPPREALIRLIRTVWRNFHDHSEFTALLTQENLLKARFVRRSEHIRRLQSPLVAMLDGLMEAGLRKGVFRRRTDPVQLYLSIVGLCYFYLSNRHTLSVIFERDLLAPAQVELRLRQVTGMVLAYLASPEDGEASP